MDRILARASVLLLVLALAALATPQAAASGLAAAAAVQEPFDGWWQRSTEHFLIIYEPRDAAQAERLASFAEDRYRRITTFFDSYPPRIRVVLNGRSDRVSGFATALPPSISLDLAAPSGPTFGAIASDWLELVFVHELTHYVHLTMQRGPLQWLAYALGPGGPWLTGIALPGWAIEGVATYAETVFTEGGRGRSSFFALRSKAPVVEGRWFNSRHASYSTGAPPAGRHYVAGYAIIDYLQREYGQDALLAVMDDYLRFPYLGPWAAMQRVTGRRFVDFYEDLRRDLAATYAARGQPVARGVDLARAGNGGEAAGNRAESADNGPEAGVGAPASGAPAPPQLFLGASTERGVLAYRRSRTAAPDLVWIDGTGTRTLTRVRLDDPYSFAATGDGSRVVYSAAIQLDTHPSGSAWVSDLYELDADTGTRRRITTLGHLWHPAIAADGTVLVAVQGVGPHSRLVVVDPHTGSLAVLAAVERGVILHPTVSADGSLVVFELAWGVDHDLYAVATSAPLAAVVPEEPLADHNRRLLVRVTGPDKAGEYFPRFVRPARGATDLLLFGGDREGALAVYAKRELTGPQRLVVEDPVGAYAGLMNAGLLYYAAYTSDGHTIRRDRQPLPAAAAVTASGYTPPPAAAISAQALPAPAPTATPSAPPASTVLPGGEPKRYLDLPLLGFLLPLPSVIDTNDTFDLGIGAVLLASSALGRSTLTLQAAYHPSLQQPLASAELEIVLGGLGIAYTADLGYAVAGGTHARTFRQELQLTFALVNAAQRDRSVRRYAALLAGVGQGYQQTATAVLTLGPDEGVSVDTNAASVGAEADWYRFAGAQDFFPPARVSGAAVFESSLSAWQPILRAGVSGQLAVFGHDVVRLQASAAHAWSDPLPAAAAPAPRGGFDLGTTSNGRGLLALDYLLPLAVLDQPLVAGSYLAGLAAGLHVEVAFDWGESVGPEILQPSADLFVGLELGAVLGFGQSQLPVGAGVAVAIPSGQVLPYVFVGLTPQSGLGAAFARR